MLIYTLNENADRLELSVVMDTLRDDYKLIAPLGEAFIRLTPEGAKMAKRGMVNYQSRLSLNEQFEVAKPLISIIGTVLSIVIGVLSLLLVDKS